MIFTPITADFLSPVRVRWITNGLGGLLGWVSSSNSLNNWPNIVSFGKMTKCCSLRYVISSVTQDEKE